MGRLEGKVAIVVGGGQTSGGAIGNGRATCLRFAHELDTTQENAFLGLVESVEEEFQKIDILHNNVGIGLNDASPLKVREEAWDRIFSVNIKSALFACKAVIAVMIKQGFGVITNISSVASIAGGVECVYLSFGY